MDDLLKYLLAAWRLRKTNANTRTELGRARSDLLRQ